jgi:hypothetical protein
MNPMGFVAQNNPGCACAKQKPHPFEDLLFRAESRIPERTAFSAWPGDLVRAFPDVSIILDHLPCGQWESLLRVRPAGGPAKRVGQIQRQRPP